MPKIKGIALFPFIFTRTKFPAKELINHERIHLRQQLEMLIIPFYIWYALEWMFHYLNVGSFWEAYRMISFEKEAYAEELNSDYLKTRKFWAFINHL